MALLAKDTIVDEPPEEKIHWKENYDDIGEFFFESDHLALKGNPDYHSLLKVIAMLEAQRSQAIRDLDTLHNGLQEALEEPLKFVQRLQRKEPMNFPEPQRIVQLPNINWNKYSLNDGSQPPPMLRQKLQMTKSEGTSKDSDADKVRGRLYNPTKPSSFNQLWTSQEQKKLEELLVLFPPEEVESRRWEKISKALGSRTPAQVASRVQKYFIHLSKAGLAVPGRAPRRTAVQQSGRVGVHRMNMLRMTSSFFRHHMPSVYMMDTEDMEDVPCPASTSQTGDEMAMKDCCMDEEDDDDKDDESFSKGGMWENPLYQELLFLQKIKQDRASSQPLVQHIGFQCDRCQCDPIVGVRWHCKECPSEKSVDFCSDCVDCQEEIGVHTADHRLEAVDQASLATTRPFLDGDYLHLMGSGQYCNYLDPNYMPATSATG